MIITNFAVEKKSNIFSEGRGKITSSLKRKNDKNYCLTNLNKLSEEKGTLYVKAKSLKQFREKYSPKISIRFSLKNTRLDNDLLNISLFSIFLCEQLLNYSSEKCVK